LKFEQGHFHKSMVQKLSENWLKAMTFQAEKETT